ncbi:hypothetical protein MTR_2g036720 [Medicago truncatula]|uniref:Uncharacterized protein n=1 Tax=Medicago truncatula TaxID=3880 RepID=G7IN09_MEDTR|nr:hypothetical protein MTR_2g036720 [Medicago truncatula]
MIHNFIRSSHLSHGCLVDKTKWQRHYKLTHTSGGTGVRTPVMTSGLTISAFCQLS